MLCIPCWKRADYGTCSHYMYILSLRHLQRLPSLIRCRAIGLEATIWLSGFGLPSPRQYSDGLWSTNQYSHVPELYWNATATGGTCRRELTEYYTMHHSSYVRKQSSVYKMYIANRSSRMSKSGNELLPDRLSPRDFPAMLPRRRLGDFSRFIYFSFSLFLLLIQFLQH